MTEVPHTEGVLLVGDWNGHVSTTTSGFQDVMGGFGLVREMENEMFSSSARARD